MEYTVFYAWQSDTDESVSKKFIRKAIERALKSIKSDATIEDAPRIDHDTKDTPGTPEIAGTIFRKIDECGVFIGDLTMVGAYVTTDGRERTKSTPNLNVALETGYAAKAIGWDRVITVMNEAHGLATELPFDMRNRRYPVTFTLRRGEPTEEVLERLAKEIALRVRDAAAQPHELVRRHLARLDNDAIVLMMVYGGVQEMDTAPNDNYSLLEKMTVSNGWRRLLELGFIELVRPSSLRNLHYKWTFLGRLALKELAFPYTDNPKGMVDMVKAKNLQPGQRMAVSPELRRYYAAMGKPLSDTTTEIVGKGSEEP